MRTTVTLEDDIAARLKQEMRDTGLPFKAALNAVLRRGFLAQKADHEIPRFEVEARPLGLRPGFELDSIADVLERLDGPLHR